ncbi:amidohydrolase family protein [Variovorax rhizosphaerae]|uniref:Amidohydrolase family protein n=1 Tax=Variovorax rhizosphaerae TaxID=1836200 RepID=A0ABU8WWB7_9BURK
MTASTPPTIFGRSTTPDESWLAKATPEAALEPDLPIIDAHLHAWHRGDHRYLIEDYARDLAASGHNVIATIAEEAGGFYRADGPAHLKCVGETEFFVGQAAMAASGKYTSARVAAGIVAFADLSLGDRTRETLAAHVAAGNGRVKGIRQNGKWDPDPVVRGNGAPGRPGLYLDPAFGEGLDTLTSFGLAFDASIYHPQLPEVATLARAHPDARIVVIHSGTPVGFGSYAGKDDEVHATWLAGMKELASCPNVHIKLGGLLIFLARFDFTKLAKPPTSIELAAMWRPYIEPCIELFGAERCMATANFPVDKAGVPYGTVWNMFKRVTEGCSADEKRLIYGDTARRVYNLDLAP